jgi:hypothetical protein
MDPISQGVVGALWAASLAPKHKLRPTLIAGALAGMAADLDVLISSRTDPLLFLEYHRQFTHSLIFVPIGALIVALSLWPVLKRRLQPKELLAACFFGLSKPWPARRLYHLRNPTVVAFYRCSCRLECDFNCRSALHPPLTHCGRARDLHNTRQSWA